jgi:hypothetical protein
LNGKLVGFVAAQLGEVTLLFVLPQATGQGIGSGLFEHGLAVAEDNCPAPVLVVATKNSESFYAAHGFVAVEEQWFERGAQSLRYPVVKMLRHSRTHTPPHHADASYLAPAKLTAVNNAGVDQAGRADAGDALGQR